MLFMEGHYMERLPGVIVNVNSETPPHHFAGHDCPD